MLKHGAIAHRYEIVTENSFTENDYRQSVVGAKVGGDSGHRGLKIFMDKRVMALVVILVLAGIYGVVFLIAINGSKNSKIIPQPDYSDINKSLEESNKKAEESMRQQASQPPPKNASKEEIDTYYANTLQVRMMTGDDVQTATYYIQEVKPRNVVLTIDIKEGLVGALLSAQYRQQAQQLITEIINEYQTRAGQSDDSAVKNYAEKKVTYYNEILGRL